MEVNLTINGSTVTKDVSPMTTLAVFLREHMLL